LLRCPYTIDHQEERWRKLVEAWDRVCLIVDGEYQLSDIDTVECPMDMPIVAAVWDKRE
jgi:hypothetical protein